MHKINCNKYKIKMIAKIAAQNFEWLLIGSFMFRFGRNFNLYFNCMHGVHLNNTTDKNSKW